MIKRFLIPLLLLLSSVSAQSLVVPILGLKNTASLTEPYFGLHIYESSNISHEIIQGSKVEVNNGLNQVFNYQIYSNSYNQNYKVELTFSSFKHSSKNIELPFAITIEPEDYMIGNSIIGQGSSRKTTVTIGASSFSLYGNEISTLNTALTNSEKTLTFLCGLHSENIIENNTPLIRQWGTSGLVLLDLNDEEAEPGIYKMDVNMTITMEN